MELIQESLADALARVQDITDKIAGAPASERATLREMAADADRALGKARQHEERLAHERKVERKAELDIAWPAIEARRLPLLARAQELQHDVDVALYFQKVLQRMDAGGVRDLSVTLAKYADVLDEMNPVNAEATALDRERIGLALELANEG